MAKQSKPIRRRVLPTILPEIRSLIEMSRHHAALTANLALVNLYWNIGRIISQDIQKNEKRAGYGEQLIEELARELEKEYGSGYSAKNLWDMKRFFSAFKILQAASGEFRDEVIRQPLANKSVGSEAVQPPAAESFLQQIRQTVSDKFPGEKILQTMSGESSDAKILQALPAESSDNILIYFGQHFRLDTQTTIRDYFLITTQRPPSVVISLFPSRWQARN